MRESLKENLRQVWLSLGEDETAREQKLGAILDRLYKLMADDVMIGFFFEGHDLRKIAAKQGEFLMRAMGARATYSGKPPNQAHLSLPPIKRGQFNRRIVILRQTLTEAGLMPNHIEAWVEFEEAFRSAVEA